METKSEYMMTEIGEIPANWEVCALGTYIKVQGGYAFKSNQFSDNGIRILRISNIKESGLSLNECKYYSDNDAKGLDNYYLNENDTVIAMSGATTGKSSLVKKDDLPLLVNQRVGTYKRKNERNTDQKFIYYTVSSNYYQQKLWEHAIGGAQPNISSTQLESIIVAYPPLNEQQKIAEILSTVDDQIEQTDQLIEKTKELKKGLMQQLLTKGVKHTAFKKTKIGEIPAEWRSVKFKEVCSIVNGLVDPREKPYSDYPHIGNANIEKKSGKLLNYKIAKEENLISGKYLFNERHVLYGKINPQFAKVTYPKFVGLCSADMYPIECDLEQIVPDFLLYAILDTRFTDTMIKLSTRTGMPKVNRFEVEQYVFALPKVNEQKKIAKILSSVDEDIEGYEQEKSKYEELKKGLMQQLLTGKTRVKVD